MRKFWKHCILFLFGAATYVGIELLYRGRSHWTMFLLGGFCSLLIGLINERFPWNMPLWKQGMAGTGIITVLEFVTGCLVNLWLHWNVWDYSGMPLNILGQVCLPFCLLWFFVSLLAVFVDDLLRWRLFGEEKPKYKIL